MVDESVQRFMIAEMPDRERPRERLQHHGAEALTDVELLAILLRSGLRGRSVLDLARQVLQAYDDDLDRLSRATVDELRGIRGIGLAKAVEIHAAFALAQRLRQVTALQKPVLDSPQAIARMFRERFRTLQQEELHALLLDTRNRLLRDETITVGLVDRSQVHPREVFRRAIRESCSRLAVVHNHPSGDPTPSQADIACTKQLLAAGRVVGIEVVDHVIVGGAGGLPGREFSSLRAEGLMNEE
ncbi:MAG: DNA repair protein RadC [Lentisphaeria bacterium]|jgi:DNA repair protein RadC|nr:DNA repair protein RadC [Lentisphaeria bacterium]